MAEIAASLQNFSYDLDGNITSDGLQDYAWDAENRLIRVETSAAAITAGFPNRLVEFKYDFMHRRVQKRVVDRNVSPAVEVSCRRFLYDGWSMVLEFNAPGGSSIAAALRSYTWGLDIARTLTDAGGVGALLQISDHASGKSYLPSYDGNGNIVALFDGESGLSGACVATYEYSPYGEPLRSEGSYAKENPFRFSTKVTDDETGLVYYGRRYYSPSQGRFLGRDPIEESGGLNLYGFVGNNPINRWDLLGMLTILGEQLHASGLSMDSLRDVDGLDLTLLGDEVWWARALPDSLAGTEWGDVGLADFLHNPREWLTAYYSGATALTEMFNDQQSQIADAFSTMEASAMALRTHMAGVSINANASISGGGVIVGVPVEVGEGGGIDLNSALLQGALDFQRGLMGVGSGNADSPSGQLGRGIANAALLVPVAQALNALRTGRAAVAAAGAAENAGAALGRGSTANLSKGTTLPRNLREQLAVEQATKASQAGSQLPIKMTDPRWPASDGWVKMQQVINSGGREGPINVHYVRNTITGAVDDFKVVVPGAR
jgi:RHS repeat-associated protein